MSEESALTSLDGIILAILIIAMARGLFIGLVRESFSIAALAAAVLAARYGTEMACRNRFLRRAARRPWVFLDGRRAAACFTGRAHTRPVRVRQSISSAGSWPLGGYAMAAKGLVSVMPQA